MAYIGREPQIGNFQVCDAISTVNNQAAYTMQVSSVNVSPETENHMLVSLNGILQRPGSSFTVSSSTITFASNLVTGDVINFIHILGSVLDLGVPSDSTVSLAKLTATGTKNSSTFLRGDNTFAEVPSGGITQVDLFRLTSDINSNSDPISSNLERADDASSGRIGTGMSESSGTFTFPETGIYECTFFVNGTCNDQNYNIIIKVTQDNSSYDEVASTSTAMSGNRDVNGVATCIVDVTDVSNDKVRFCTSSMSGNSNTVIRGNTALNHTYFRFVRLGDT